ncbi:hypothetical protein A2Z33_04000 [Candidatus Gottesmanbacteria bacterium RBG_16_52_11]|uniref:Glycosyltransferase RgtA/B/C/D-like domain-containing protein n=1 Tax=Candidatus Gottesmanbacteria bacterium RBG_16_52_11 TaxID=1798374 RepID=A0A1F5YVY7_9BACT|nr:MAG: hypothetical protein A2Z33_04000 [Candidatus Gottesmanbacteria bacterium RBG_16_52_11]
MRLIPVLIRKQTLLTIVFLLYIALILFGVFHHEPWRDEAHAWMMARQDSIPTIIDNAKYEGTPVLWFMMLVPFAKFGFPYQTMNFLHGVIAITFAFLLLKYGKFPSVVKVLMLFSYFFAYEYSIIARNYVLTVVLLFAIASLHALRFDRPLRYATLVALLFQTNLYSIVPAGVLMVLNGFQLMRSRLLSPQRLAALSIMFASALITFFMLIPDPAYSINPDIPKYPLEQIPVILRNAFIPSFDHYRPLNLDVQSMDGAISIITAILFIALFVKVLRNGSALLITAASLGWLLLINAFIHTGNTRHHGLFQVYIIFLWWFSETVQAGKSKFESGVKAIFFTSLSILLVISWAYTAYLYSQDYTSNFSGSKNTAEFIVTRNLLHMDIVAYRSSHGIAVLPYFKDKQFWYPEYGKTGYYNLFDVRYHKPADVLKPADALVRIKATFGTKPHLLLLSSPIEYTFPGGYDGYELLYESRGSYIWSSWPEEFFLYSYGDVN